MTLRIACDLDGTVADMETALQREAETLFGAEVDLRAGQSLPLVPLQSPSSFDGSDDAPAAASASAPQPAPGRPLTARERRKLWSHVATVESFWRGLKEIEPGGVACETELGDTFELEADAVVLVTQRVSDEALYLELAGDRGALEGVYRVGDCVAPRLIADAIWDGHRLGREIDSADPAQPLPHLRERPGLEADPVLR